MYLLETVIGDRVRSINFRKREEPLKISVIMTDRVEAPTLLDLKMFEESRFHSFE
jgi:hypothetical protein